MSEAGVVVYILVMYGKKCLTHVCMFLAYISMIANVEMKYYVSECKKIISTEVDNS